MTRYHILYTRVRATQRVVSVLDFCKGNIIAFTMDEWDNNSLEEELKRFIETNRAKIDKGYWDYSG